MGHELRNPLGAIKNTGYFPNMALKEPEPEVKETLEILEKEVGTSERIILNAIQAMPDGGRLVVKSEVSTPEWVGVSFADTGMGIPEENLEKLFEPLFTTKAKGIGLGLAVTKILMEGHGGTIEVQSKAEKGSTFMVRLPMGGKEEK